MTEHETNDFYVRISDVLRLIDQKIEALNHAMARGKGLKNSIINLSALRKEIDHLDCIKVGHIKEETIWRGGK